MRVRMILGSVLVPLVLACGGAGDAGGSTTAVAEPAAPSAPARNLAFSNWKIEWVSGGSVKEEFDFLPDGKFVDPKYSSHINTYQIDGDKIHMEYDSGFIVYEGEFVSDYKMGGTFKTRRGVEGSWRGVQLAE